MTRSKIKSDIMKNLTEYLNENVRMNEALPNDPTWKIRPDGTIIATDETIRDILKDELETRGENFGVLVDLNNIDVSRVTDMDGLFAYEHRPLDISQWDVSNVKTMKCMFEGSRFNGDISRWDVRNVKNMESMFEYSAFEGDISGWKVNRNCKMNRIFKSCPLEKNPPKWYKN